MKRLLIAIMLSTIATAQPVITNKPADPNFKIHRTDPQTEHTTAMIFAHGIGATHNQGMHHFARYASRNIDGSCNSNRYWLFDEPIVTFDFPDCIGSDQFNKFYVNLGQQLDQERLQYIMNKTKEELPSCTGIIGSGISRGAVVWLNYAAQYRPDNLKALILESPFDNIKTVMQHLLRRFHISWVPFSTSVSIWAAKKKFPMLNFNGPFPFDVVDQINKDLPIFLVHSRSDNVIPSTSSRKLYIRLLQSGHMHVYLLELARGEHGKVMQGMEAELYQNCVHAFLQKYDLPHCAEFAQRGRSLLATCQPSVPEVQKWIKQKRGIAFDAENDEQDADASLFLP